MRAARSEWLTWPLKILRTGLLFLVLIVQATYTANLAAFLSAPSIEIHGPATMDGLAQLRTKEQIAEVRGVEL